MTSSPCAYLVKSKTRLTALVKAIEKKFPLQREPQRAVRKVMLDTFDWRLFARGSRLCLVTDDGHTTLSLETSKQRLTCRAPNAGLPAFEADIPAGRLHQRVAPIIGVRRLLPRLEIALEVQTIRLLNADEKTVARLHIQHGTAADPENSETTRPLPAVVLLTPVRGYQESQRIAAELIEQQIGLLPAAHAPLDIAMQAVGIEPGTYAAKRTLALDAGTRADEATVAICRELLETMRANEEGVRKNLDSEFLHDFRVAVRRTRSALRLLKGVLPNEARAHFKSEFKWLGSITGALRDLDVYLLKMPLYRAELPESMRQDLDPLDEYLRRHHRAERRRLANRLKSKRYAELLSTWEAFLERVPSDDAPGPDAARPIIDIASKRIWKAYQRVHKCGRKIAPETLAEVLHELRIDCKMLRYLLEFFRSLYPPKEIAKLIGALRRLQDNLGDFNDLHVQQANLRRFAREMSDEGLASTDSVLAMGRLVEHLHQRQLEERQRFAQCWSDFATPANGKRYRTLFRIPKTETETEAQ